MKASTKKFGGKGKKMPMKSVAQKTTTPTPMKHAHKGVKMIPNKGIKAQGTLMSQGKKIPAAKGSDRSMAVAKHGMASGHVTKTVSKFSSRKFEAMRKDVFGLAKKEDAGKI